MQIIARVRLAPGQVGFFDELTRIHLTIANPEKPVFAGSNTSIIRRSVASGRLLLVSGSLEDTAVKPQQNIAPIVPPTPVAPQVQESGVIDIPTAPAQEAEPVTQEPAAEPADPQQEEVATEETPQPEPVEGSTDQSDEPAAEPATTEENVEPAENAEAATDAPAKKTTRKK